MSEIESEEKIIHTFPKGDDEEVRLAVHKYKGRFYIDLRVWFQDETTQGFRPTRKGVSVPADRFTELKMGLEKLIRSIENGEIALPAETA